MRASLLVRIFLMCLCWQSLSAQAESTSPTPTIFTQTSTWAEDNGDSVKLSKWQGMPLIVAMAYTECTRVCNATLHKLEEAQLQAEQKKISLQFIVISFDPSIDNPTSWSYYRKQHHLTDRANWHFLTGSSASTKKLAMLLGIQYWLDEDHVMHDMRILSINPDGSIKTFLDWDHQDVASLFKFP